ncbi:MAG: AMP-binding protein [Planctomycetota bacterium]|nr:AMP-binding protein [Planctomycetota bacterium]
MYQASQLSKQGIKAKDRVLLLDLDPHLNIPTLFGLWIIGATPLQMALPPKFQSKDLTVILERWHCHWALTSWLKPLHHEQLTELEDWSLPTDSQGEIAPERLKANPESLAFLQLTSGSTGSPRAVAIGEQRLCKHLAAMSISLPPGPNPLTVSWLPLYHDMGLVGGLLYTLFNGSTLVAASPKAFQRWPFMWPQLLSDHKASITVAPPSAYALLARLGPRIRRKGLDLSNIHQFVMGASPIPASVVRDLKKSLAPSGLKETVMVPAYGMAEATLAISFPKPHSLPKIDSIKKAPFETKGQAVKGQGLEFVSVGRAINGTKLRIVDDDGVEQQERRVGEIQIRSDSLMLGYTTGESIQSMDQNKWFSTGDLGYLAEGHLFVSGRSKELIICNGRNFFPDNIELTASEHPKIKSGTVAAIGLDSKDKSDQLIVLVLESRLDNGEKQELAKDLQQFMKIQLVPVSRIAFTNPGTLPRTTSGKLKRAQILKNQEKLNFLDITPLKKPSFLDSLVKRQIRGKDPKTESQIAQFILKSLNSALPIPAKQLSSQASLLEMGADSLTRSDLQFQIESRFNIDLPIGLFDSDKSVEEIAALCSELREQSQAANQKVMEPASQSIPWSPLQWRFLFSPSKPERRSEIILHLRCPNDLSVEALSQSLNWLTARHQALRLRLRKRNEGWDQYDGGASSSVSLELKSIPPGTSIAEFGLNTVLELRSKLNIEEGRNLCAALISKDEKQSVLILVVNHFVCDGWSMAILLSDLEKAYRAFSLEQSPRTQALPNEASVSEWTLALKELAERSDRSLLTLNCSRYSPGADTWFFEDEVPFTGPQSHALAKSFLTDRDRHDFLLTIFIRAWAEATGRNEGVVQLENHGRGQLGNLDSRRTVGWLAMRYPFSFKVRRELSVTEQTRDWRREMDSRPYFGLATCALEAYSQAPEDRAMPDIQFDLRGQSFENPNKLGLFPAIRSSATDNFRRLGETPMGLTVKYKSREQSYRFYYDPTLIKSDIMKSLIQHFSTMLQANLMKNSQLA